MNFKLSLQLGLLMIVSSMINLITNYYDKDSILISNTMLICTYFYLVEKEENKCN